MILLPHMMCGNNIMLFFCINNKCCFISFIHVINRHIIINRNIKSLGYFTLSVFGIKLFNAAIASFSARFFLRKTPHPRTPPLLPPPPWVFSEGKRASGFFRRKNGVPAPLPHHLLRSPKGRGEKAASPPRRGGLLRRGGGMRRGAVRGCFARGEG